jgi:hypothetical protein
VFSGRRSGTPSRSDAFLGIFCLLNWHQPHVTLRDELSANNLNRFAIAACKANSSQLLQPGAIVAKESLGQARSFIVGQTVNRSPISEHSLYLTLFASSAGGL